MKRPEYTIKLPNQFPYIYFILFYINIIRNKVITCQYTVSLLKSFTTQQKTVDV